MYNCCVWSLTIDLQNHQFCRCLLARPFLEFDGNLQKDCFVSVLAIKSSTCIMFVSGTVVLQRLTLPLSCRSIFLPPPTFQEVREENPLPAHDLQFMYGELMGPETGNHTDLHAEGYAVFSIPARTLFKTSCEHSCQLSATFSCWL